jgi:hypothetical protein
VADYDQNGPELGHYRLCFYLFFTDLIRIFVAVLFGTARVFLKQIVIIQSVDTTLAKKQGVRRGARPGAHPVFSVFFYRAE